MRRDSFGHTNTATANGTNLAYRERGEGEPVVFVHGGISDLRTWEQQLTAIGREYRAITYSRRGYRPNKCVDPSTRDLIALAPEDLAAFLREIDAAPAHLVGNSIGAYFSLLVAIRHPDLVRSLVIEEPPVVPLFMSNPPRVGELLHLFATRPRTAVALLRFGFGTMEAMAKVMRQGEEERAARIFTRGVLGEETFMRLAPARWEQVLENLSELHAFAQGENFLPINDNEIRSIHVPVLMMTGEHSPSGLIRLTDRLEELLPRAERLKIPDASHLMHEDNAPTVNQAIVEFLGRHCGR